MSEQNSLTLFTKAAQMLAEANTIQKAKELQDLALTALDWAKRKKMGKEAEQYCVSYALEAERKMGMMLLETERAKGTDKSGRKNLDGSRKLPSNPPPTLKELGVSKKESSKAQKIASLKEDVFEEIRNGNKTFNDIKKEERKQEIQTLKKNIEEGKIELPKGTYEVIVIDPPWRYGDKDDAGYDSEGFRGTTPYPTMSIDDIKKLKIPSSKDCVLWLWTTQKHLRYAFDILDSWGFEDKAILTWCKNKMGIGKWLRSKSEFCVMAVKGKPTINLTNQTTVLNADVGIHSRKPDEFYAMVEELCIGRKLDYFSREKRKGWDTFGTMEKVEGVK